jgi:flagellar assembly factor FliW
MATVEPLRVATTRFGSVEVAPSAAVVFEEGLLGFPEAHRFALIAADDGGDLYWLQSLDDGALAFLSTSPWTSFPDYEPDIPEPDREALDLDSADDASVLCLLTIDREHDMVTANLLGPVVINLRSRRARQVVLHEQGWPIAARLGGDGC